MRNARLLMPAIRFPDWEFALPLAERGVGGFCIWGRDTGAVARLQDAAPHPLLIASDIESCGPPAAALGPLAAETAGARIAVEARADGITMTFAPVCDVLSNPSNPIVNTRAFPDPEACAPRFVAGARRMGLRTCAKHFPGHGATGADSHEELPVAELVAERDLPPFQACIDAGVDAVMTAHVAYPDLCGGLPATLSRAVVTDLLRDRMGFEGLVVTDALVMEGVRSGRTEAEAATLAIEAGCDVVLCPGDVEGVLAALERVEADASLGRMAAAAEPLPGPMALAAAASVTSHGELPVGPGPHPLRICDLHGEAKTFPKVAWERVAPDGTPLASGGEGTGLAAPCVALFRHDKAWGKPVGIPGLVAGAALVIVCGPRSLIPEVPNWVHAPGDDDLTLEAVAKRAFGR